MGNYKGFLMMDGTKPQAVTALPSRRTSDGKIPVIASEGNEVYYVAEDAICQTYDRHKIIRCGLFARLESVSCIVLSDLIAEFATLDPDYVREQIAYMYQSYTDKNRKQALGAEPVWIGGYDNQKFYKTARLPLYEEQHKVSDVIKISCWFNGTISNSTLLMNAISIDIESVLDEVSVDATISFSIT